MTVRKCIRCKLCEDKYQQNREGIKNKKKKKLKKEKYMLKNKETLKRLKSQNKFINYKGYKTYHIITIKIKFTYNLYIYFNHKFYH